MLQVGDYVLIVLSSLLVSVTLNRLTTTYEGIDNLLDRSLRYLND